MRRLWVAMPERFPKCDIRTGARIALLGAGVRGQSCRSDALERPYEAALPWEISSFT